MYTTVTTYYRLRIVDILPRNVSKALYLDGDIIVERDLKEL
ncbi:MAG: glycosyltransferase family 8 protein, partial [Alphaproteobacteria bacterium]|nr:glycosyltransferase family 8 protein [Alphaproteobacteria bacterium]